MLTIYSEDHYLRNAKTELHDGELVRPFECPERVETILARLNTVGLGEIRAPKRFGLDPVARIHDPGFLEFLANAWEDWLKAGNAGEMIPTNWPARRMAQRAPDNIDGKLGYYAMAAETSITDGTWAAAQASADVALTAGEAVRQGARAAFALCRPPGHHATTDMFGGYCFLNNAAITAQNFLDHGAKRVAILDVDFHHGNGTQDIFYNRGDVFFTSLHGRPEDAFPYFLGYAGETGAGKGEDCTLNLPMGPGTAYDVWGAALAKALQAIARFKPDALIVSLGVDTFKDDPISFFKLDSDDYRRYGEAIASLGLPTLFVMEGGYAVEAIGTNTVNVLEGFEQG